MRTFANCAAIAALTLVVSATAGAQMSKPAGFSIRGGAFFPSDSAAKALGNTWLGAGVEWKGGDINKAGYTANSRAHWSISVDWYGKSNASAMPVLVNYVEKNQNFYWSVGAGISMLDDGTDNMSKFGYSLALGWDAPNNNGMPWFIEGRYFGSSETVFNGFGTYVGIRF